MVRSLAVAFGAVTVLAMLASLTPRGQAMLGLRPAAKATPVTVIEDKPVGIPVPSPEYAARPAPASPRPPATRPPRARSGPVQGGLEAVANIANILLNLPQMLDQTHVGPAPSSETKPAESKKGNDAGDND